LAVGLAARFGRESHFGIYFQHIGKRSDFLSGGIVERSWRFQI